MKIKLNMFRAMLIVFITIYILALLFYILVTFTGAHAIPKELLRISVLGDSIKTNFYSYFVLTTIIDILLIYALIQLLRIGDYFKNRYFFTSKIIDCLKLAGKYFVIVAVVGFLASVFYHYCFSEHFIESMLLPFFYHFMVLIIGIGLLVIEEIQKRALLIKKENDLTI